MGVRIRWHDEEVPRPDGNGMYTRRVAWIVADNAPAEGVRYLAYLGPNPKLTDDLKREFGELYSDLEVDWDALETEVEKPRTHAAQLTFDELAFRMRSLLGEHGIELDAVDSKFGRGRYRPLREIERLLARPAVAARFERTSGSVFRYFRQRHPDYAYALLKVRLLLESRSEELKALEDEEPAAAQGGAFRGRKDFFLSMLERHLGGE